MNYGKSGLRAFGFGVRGSGFRVRTLFLFLLYSRFSLITRTIVFFSRFFPALFFQLFLRWFSMLAKMLVNPVLIFFFNASKMVLYTLLIKKFIFSLFLWDKFV